MCVVCACIVCTIHVYAYIHTYIHIHVYTYIHKYIHKLTKVCQEAGEMRRRMVRSWDLCRQVLGQEEGSVGGGQRGVGGAGAKIKSVRVEPFYGAALEQYKVHLLQRIGPDAGGASPATPATPAAPATLRVTFEEFEKAWSLVLSRSFQVSNMCRVGV